VTVFGVPWRRAALVGAGVFCGGFTVATLACVLVVDELIRRSVRL
jgi:hypothetical protein